MEAKLLLCIFVVFLSLSQVLGKATLSIQMSSYRNTKEHDWNGKCCDPWCVGQCDTRLRFCLDSSSGNRDYTNTCSYKKVTTGEYKDKNNIDFSSDMIGARNPVEHEFTAWPTSGVLFKVYIEDDDKGHSDHDTIDKMYYTFKATPAVSESRAEGTRKVIRGQRDDDKTELEVVWRVYCNQYYFGSTCTKYCKSQNNELQGHYNCDPDNGNKICRPGWEDPHLNCKTFSDDCLNVDCQNGGQCVDGKRDYTCTCASGFTGDHCESNINECASLPCQNGGSCVDGVDEYSCTCPDGYLGKHCELHICTVANECENGGKCYLKDDGTTGCYCTQAYTGSKCSVEKCSLLDCKNGGTCDNGTCHCKYEYFGSDCATDWCDVITCLHGAACDNRTCICTEGYTGKHCENEINMCESDPCMHEGACINELNRYECKCLPDYNGTHCEQYMEPIFDMVVGDTPAPPVDDESTDVTGKPTAQPVDQPAAFWIIGVVLAICILIAIFLVLMAYCCRRRRKEPAEDISPEGDSPSFANPVYVQNQLPPGGHSNLGMETETEPDHNPLRNGSISVMNSHFNEIHDKKRPPSPGIEASENPYDFIGPRPTAIPSAGTSESPYDNLGAVARQTSHYDTPPAYKPPLPERQVSKTSNMKIDLSDDGVEASPLPEKKPL